MFNPYKKVLADCYADVDFAGLWGYENPQDPICASSITGLYIKADICMDKNTRRMHFVRNGEECNFHKTIWSKGFLRLADIGTKNVRENELNNILGYSMVRLEN